LPGDTVKDEVAELINMSPDIVEDLLEEGDLIACKVEVLHVFEHDELVAHRVGILVGNDRAVPVARSTVERILKRTIDTLEGALKSCQDNPHAGFAQAHNEPRNLH